MLHVASSSDTPEQVAAVLAGEPAPVPAPEIVATPAGAEPVVETPGEGIHAEAPAADPALDTRPRRGSPEARIAKERAKRGEAERILEAERQRTADLLRENEALRQRVAAPVPVPVAPVPAPAPDPAVVLAGEPQIENFDSVGEYNSAHARWVITEARAATKDENDKRDAAHRDRVAREDADRAAATARTEFTTRAKQFMKTRPDYDTVIASAPQDLIVPPVVQETIVHHPDGPAIAYYLGQHHDELRAITRLSPIQQAIKMGEIVAAVKVASRPGSTPRASTVTQAPDPPSAAVGTGRAASPATLESVAARPANLAAYKALRAVRH